MSEPRPRVIRVSSGEFNDAEYERELARQPKMELPPIETEVIATQPKAPGPAPVRQQQQQQPPQPKQQQHPPQKRRTPPPPTTPRTARVPVYEPEAPLSAAGAAAASKLTSSSPIVRLLSVVPEPDEELAKLRDVETYVRDLAKCARSLRASVLTETATGEALTIVAGMFAEDLLRRVEEVREALGRFDTLARALRSAPQRSDAQAHEMIRVALYRGGQSVAPPPPQQPPTRRPSPVQGARRLPVPPPPPEPPRRVQAVEEPLPPLSADVFAELDAMGGTDDA